MEWKYLNNIALSKVIFCVKKLFLRGRAGKKLWENLIMRYSVGLSSLKHRILLKSLSQYWLLILGSVCLHDLRERIQFWSNNISIRMVFNCCQLPVLPDDLAGNTCPLQSEAVWDRGPEKGGKYALPLLVGGSSHLCDTSWLKPVSKKPVWHSEPVTVASAEGYGVNNSVAFQRSVCSCIAELFLQLQQHVFPHNCDLASNAELENQNT